eukprot:PhM_4_TR8073/c0_g1_i1/m.49587
MLRRTALRCHEISAAKQIFELRTYNVSPQHFPSFMIHTANFLHLRVKHSKLLGYWSTEIGGVNQVVHIWAYDSLTHRRHVRDTLVRDQQWFNSYMSIMRPMLVSQDNSLLLWHSSIDGLASHDLPQEIPKVVTADGTPPGYYRLVESRVPRVMTKRNQYMDLLRETVKKNEEAGKDVRLYGCWWSAFAGDYNRCYSLWRSHNLDDLMFGGMTKHGERWELDEDPASVDAHGKLLLPTPFSRQLSDLH